MPIYRILNTTTNIEEEHLMSWDVLQTYLAAHPEYKLQPAAPAIVSGVSGQMKPSEGFRDILRNIKKNHRGSTIDVP